MYNFLLEKQRKMRL